MVLLTQCSRLDKEAQAAETAEAGKAPVALPVALLSHRLMCRPHAWIRVRLSGLALPCLQVLPQLLAGSIVAAKVLQARILGRPHPKPSCKRKACKAGDPTAAEGFEAEDEALEQERSSQGRQQRRRTAISWRASLPAQLFEPCCDER